MKFVYAQNTGVTRCLTDDASLKKNQSHESKNKELGEEHVSMVPTMMKI